MRLTTDPDNITNHQRSNRIAALALLSLASIALFLGFYRNQWQVVREKKFSLFQKDVESYVIARMVWSRAKGLLSTGGLLGWGDVTPTDIHEEDYQYQYDAYLKGYSFRTYLPKLSHPGFQGLFFSALDRLSPLSHSDSLRLFRMLTSGLLALTLAAALLWFLRAVGWIPAIFVFLSILSSQWMTLFGRNLFFFTWLFYLPFVVLLWRLGAEHRGKILPERQLFWLVLCLILVKCLFNGYDFILPTLVMTASPLVFYAVRSGWGWRKFLRRFGLVSAAAVIGVLISILVLTLQNFAASGSFSEGAAYLLETFNRRTSASDPALPSIYQAAQHASLWSILRVYLTESYFSKPYFPYYAVILVFAAASVLYLGTGGLSIADTVRRSRGLALLASTWFSLLSPLTWYTLFKSVAYFHFHMNYLPLHMPFTLFGFALCGFVLEGIFPGRWLPQKLKEG